MITNSLIIPCYNEKDNLSYLIKQCKELPLKNTEIIFVNNGSTDGSEKIFTKLLSNTKKNLRHINIKKNIGYGDGIIQGLKEAKGSFLGWTHADLQTHPKDAISGFNYFKKQKSNKVFVKGKRKKRKLSENFFSIGMSIFESILFQTTFYEINAQPNLFSRDFFLSWKQPPNDFSLDLYVYFKAKKDNLHIKRFNV